VRRTCFEAAFRELLTLTLREAPSCKAKVKEMALTVGELTKLTGVTVRTLHHYDELGLVSPSQRTRAGYRLYSDSDVLRLHQVLLFRELGLPLEEIACALDDVESQEELLREHRGVLLVRRARLDEMLTALDARLSAFEKGSTMSTEEMKALFDGFDPTEYDEEVQQRWGQSEAFKESARRTKRYGKDEWDQYKREARSLADRIVACMHAGVAPDDDALQRLVEEHRMLIDRWFYPCSVAHHRRLATLYVSDPRFSANLDQTAPGYAHYLSEAIASSRELP
jgi:DNA-binding transcriptional MerR regulator